MAPGARPRGRAVTDVLRCRGAHGTVGSWVITVPPGRRHRGLRDVRAPRAVYWHFVHELLLLRHGTVGNAMPQSQLRRPFRSSLIRCARPVIRLRPPLRPPFTDFTRFADRGVWTNSAHLHGCGMAVVVTVSLRRMTAGSGYQYLLRSVAAGDGARALSTPLTRYYSEVGTPPGRWLGSGVRRLGAVSSPRECR